MMVMERLYRLAPRAARGMLLWLTGLFAICTGLASYIISEPSPSKEQALAYQRLAADPDVFGWIMVSVGLFAVITAYCPNGRDRLGLTAMAAWAGLWAFGFLWSAVFFGAGLAAAGPLLVWTFIACVCGTAMVKLAGTDVVR